MDRMMVILDIFSTNFSQLTWTSELKKELRLNTFAAQQEMSPRQFQTLALSAQMGGAKGFVNVGSPRG
jgi:hypothetical protein